jgi:hypothetical protein
MSILHLFFAIIGVLLVSIAFIVVNLIYHLKITSRLNNLEKDIEKKTLEFDALKKDRPSGHSTVRQEFQADMQTKVFEMPLSQSIQQPIEEDHVEEGSIQIVRNVRGTFETTDTVVLDQGYSEAPDKTEDLAARPKIKAASVAPSDAPSFSPPLKKQTASPSADIVIPLFSRMARGPDFNQLYQSLVDAMKTSADRTIAFDLAGIESLDDGELEYLEKIYLSLVSQRRSLVFLHCSGYLAALIRLRPQIAPLIR